MKTFVDGLYKLTDYQFYLFSINCKLQIAIFTVFTVKTKNFGHLYILASQAIIDNVIVISTKRSTDTIPEKIENKRVGV